MFLLFLCKQSAPDIRHLIIIIRSLLTTFWLATFFWNGGSGKGSCNIGKNWLKPSTKPPLRNLKFKLGLSNVYVAAKKVTIMFWFYWIRSEGSFKQKKTEASFLASQIAAATYVRTMESYSKYFILKILHLKIK